MIKFRNSLNLRQMSLAYPTACCQFDSLGHEVSSKQCYNQTKLLFYKIHLLPFTLLFQNKRKICNRTT